MVTRRLALAALLASAPIVSLAQDALWIRTCRVHDGSGAGAEGARIVVKDGRITDVGPDVARPAFSTEVDVHALHVTPGFVVPMTRLAMPPPPPPPPGDALRIGMHPDAKAADDALWRDETLRALLLSGVTTVGVLPASAEPGIPGHAGALSTLPGTKAQTVIAEQPALVIDVATVQPWRRQVALAFEKADASRRDLEASKEDGGDAGPLVQCLLKKRPVLLLAPTPAELQAARDAMPLERMDVSVLDGTDLWWLAKDVRAREPGMRVVTYPSLVRQRGTRHPINRAAEWNAAGVKVAFALPEDSPQGAQRLRDAVIELVRAGLPREKALAALTSQAAAALGVADQCGAVEKGHRADLLFWSGDPLEPTSRLERIMVSGRFVDMPPDAQP